MGLRWQQFRKIRSQSPAPPPPPLPSPAPHNTPPLPRVPGSPAIIARPAAMRAPPKADTSPRDAAHEEKAREERGTDRRLLRTPRGERDAGASLREALGFRLMGIRHSSMSPPSPTSPSFAAAQQGLSDSPPQIPGPSPSPTSSVEAPAPLASSPRLAAFMRPQSPGSPMLSTFFPPVSIRAPTPTYDSQTSAAAVLQQEWIFAPNLFAPTVLPVSRELKALICAMLQENAASRPTAQQIVELTGKHLGIWSSP